jgi:hypothetical protein
MNFPKLSQPARICIVSLIAFPAAALAAPPANDSFANSVVISAGGGQVSGTNVEATKETGEPNHDGKLGGKSVWWTWTPSTGSSVTIDTIGSNFDTVLAIYTGTSVNALTPVASNDDAAGGFTSRVAFTAIAGTAYRIAVDGYDGDSGSITLTVGVAGPPPANDNFADAIAIPTAGGSTTGTNVNASKEPGEPPHDFKEGGRSVWWSWTPADNMNVTVATTGSTFDTVLAVYTGSSVSGLIVVASNDDEDPQDPIGASRVTFTANAGITYRIVVDGFAGAAGDISLLVQPTSGVRPPNDDFANRILFPATGGNRTGTNVDGTKEAGEPNHAANIGGKSVWWTWTPIGTATVSISTAGSSFDTLLAVYTGTAVNGLTLVVANDDDTGIGGTSRVTFDATAGQTYQIAVDGWDGESGNISLTIDTVVFPPAAPVANQATGAGLGGFVASWNAVSGATGYRLDVSTSNSFANFLPGYQGIDLGNSLVRSVSGLTAGTTYYYRVRAYNSAGESSNSTTITVTTATVPFSGLTNVSTRAFAGSGEATLIMGFYIAGTGSKTLIIRGVGPGLVPHGVPVVVANPSLTLYTAEETPVFVATNDNWNSSLAADFLAVGAFSLTPGSLDSALKVTLPPGGYTIHLVNPGPVAEALIEVYDLSKDSGTHLVNLSCRLAISPGQNVIVGTFMENQSVPVLIRGVGPTLAGYGVQGAAGDTFLRIYDASETLIAQNDDWDPALEPFFESSGAFSLLPGSKDAAHRLTFNPGLYSAHATVVGSGGIVLVEFYQSN